MDTSKELSKKLADNGCELESKNMVVKYSFRDEPQIFLSDIDSEIEMQCLSGEREYTYRSYDILNEICVKYAKEFFGDEFTYHTERILKRMQLNNGMIEGLVPGCKMFRTKHNIDAYIWKHCKFNPNNK